MSTTALKLIALALMTVDHIGEFIPNMPLWLRYIGRLSACIFFFCAVEGYTHTGSKRNYLLRLYLMNLLMTGIDIALPMLLGQKGVIPNNVFLEIFTMLFLVHLWDTYAEDKQKRILFPLLFIGYQIAVYWLMSGLLRYSSNAEISIVHAILGCPLYMGANTIYVGCLIPIFYFCRNNKKRLAACFSGWVLLFCIYTVFAVPALVFNPLLEFLHIDTFGFNDFGTVCSRAFRTDFQWMMLFSLPLLLAYNGKRGKGPKYFFYVYYPVHIAILYTAGVLIGRA